MIKESSKQNVSDSTNHISEHGEKRHAKRKWPFIVICVIVFAIIISAGALLYSHRSRGPLPESVVKNASFPIYYPTPLPQGFSYENSSAKLTDGVLFYTLESNGLKVSISEESAPSNPPDLSHLPGFTSFQTIAGNAVTGSSNGLPIGIVLSNTTMVIINGAHNVPSLIINNLIRSLNTLQEQQ